MKKGDTLWELSRSFLGAPTQWRRIYSYNNRPEMKAKDLRLDVETATVKNLDNSIDDLDFLLVSSIALAVTISTDFLWGAGFADDAIITPAAFAAIRSGVTRTILPVVTAGAAAACSSSSNSQRVTGMPCKAAHTQ